MRGVEHLRQPARRAVVVGGQPGDEAQPRAGVERQHDQDQPARQHHRDEDQHQEHAEHGGETAADFTQRAEGGSGDEAGAQVDDAPGDGGGDVDEGEARRAHAHHAGDSRNDGLHAGNEAADEDALAAVVAKIGLAALDQRPVAREWPDRLDAVLVMVPHPVGDRVAGDGAQRRPDEDRPGVELAQADQRSRPHEHHRRWHDHADQEQGLPHGDEEHDGICKGGVLADEGHELIEDVGHGVLLGFPGLARAGASRVRLFGPIHVRARSRSANPSRILLMSRMKIVLLPPCAMGISADCESAARDVGLQGGVHVETLVTGPPANAGTGRSQRQHAGRAPCSSPRDFPLPCPPRISIVSSRRCAPLCCPPSAG